MVNFAVLIDGVLEADYFLPVCMVVTVVFLLVGLGVIVKTTSWSREANECVAQMRNVCDDFSSQHQGISFHFREARVDQEAFIEVYVSTHEEMAQGIIVATELDMDFGKKTTSEELVALKSAKNILGDDEYQMKRGEIL
ncbi:hypothetical protein ACHAWX_000744 [Stephanocyclus meneghinianus]